MSKLDKYTLCGAMDVPPSAKLLYLMLLELANAKGKVTLSHRQISATVGLARSTISRNLQHLHAAGYIQIRTKTSVYGARLPNQYIVFARRYKC